MKPINKLGIVNLISSVAFAAVATIWTVYLESYLHNPSYVGFLTSFLTIVTLFSFIFLVPFIERNSKAKLYTLAIIGYLFSYILFSLFESIYLIILVSLLVAVVVSLRITCFGILVREKVKVDKVSEGEGLIYTSLNIAWLIGPLIAGFIASKYSTKWVFIFAALVLALEILLFKIFGIKSKSKNKKVDKNMFKLIKSYLSDKDRIFSYILGGGITFWWSLIYIYMPIYIIEKGLGDIALGIFLAAIIVPLILLELYFSRITEKKGFRKTFFWGYLILSGCAFLCFFFSSIYVILGILVLASVGAAMVEPMSEAYFFDIVSEKQREKFYGPYNTSIEVGGFLATSISAVILLFLPFNYIFIFFGIGTLALALMSLKIRNVVESRRG